MREPLAADLTPATEAVLLDGLRAMTPATKLQHTQALQEAALVWLRAGIRRRQPDGTPHTWREAEVQLRLGTSRVTPFLEVAMTHDPPPTFLSVTLQVLDALDALAIPYMLVGSLASIIHGEYRTTNDTDLVVVCTASHAQPLVDRLAGDFLIRLPDVLDGLAQTGQFSATHLATMFRIDFFVRASTPFAAMEFQRRQAVVIQDDPARTAWVATVEDTILSKLRWYQLGGGVSDRQWRDVQAMLRVNADTLDHTYLQQWAATLQLTTILDAALRGERPSIDDSADDSQQTRMF